jgi:hypothetical protein
MAIMIQSSQKQKRTKPAVDTRIGKLQFQSTKQIQSQISQLQRQVIRIQKYIQRIRTVPTKRTNTRLRNYFLVLAVSLDLKKVSHLRLPKPEKAVKDPDDRKSKE